MFKVRPLLFESNAGQMDPAAKYVARGRQYSVFLTETDAVVSLPEATEGAFRLSLAGANLTPRIKPLGQSAIGINYFRGPDPARWMTNVANYPRVKYEQVYPGIDVEYYGRDGELEYDFLVDAGADPSRINMRLTGAERIGLRADGDLEIVLRGKTVALKKPVAYQDIDGERRSVESRYELAGPSAVRFALGSYDRAQPLVIDPILSYSTYLGGLGDDLSYGIAVDSAGSAYVAGIANTGDFPVTSGAYDVSFAGPTNSASGGDVVVFKVNSAGALVYATYMGGAGNDRGYAIAVDASGNAYVAGSTNSSNYPVTSGAFQPTTGTGAGSFGDAFVTKLNASGSALVYSSYLGGVSLTHAYGIAVDTNGNAFVAGTVSNSFNTTNPLVKQPTAGGSDAYVVKINPAGSGLIYAKLLGGTGSDTAYALAIDSSGNAYVIGQTTSTNLPTANAGDPTFTSGGAGDAFVAKFDPSGSVLYSTYLGGSGSEYPGGIAVDGSGNAYVTGYTSSSDFAVTSGALDTQMSGGSDAFVVKYTPTGAIGYSTFLGGTGFENGPFVKSFDTGGAITVDSAGTAYVTGSTDSSNFPVTDALQSTNAGNTDGFVARLNAAGSALLFSSYIGGSGGSDEPQAIAVDSTGRIYLTGSTRSSNWPTASPVQSSYGGNGDIFVARITPTAALPAVTVDRSSLAFSVVTSGASVTNVTPAQTLRLAKTGTDTVTWTVTSSQPWLTVSPASGSVPGSVSVSINTATLPSTTSASATITFALNGAGTSSVGVPVTLTKTTDTSSPPPIGTIDTPAENATLAGSVAVTGWSLDNVGVKRVEIWRDLQPGETTPPFSSTPADPRHGKIFIANAVFVDGARPDVEGLYVSMPFAYRAGWGYLLLTWGLYNQGNGTYKIYAYSFDQEDHVATLGVKTVTFSNATATKPFGSIDTPAIGGDAGTLPNFGWALTPKVNGVATCRIQSSGVQVSIDSGPLQPVAYGDARSDIAGAFPGFSNTAAAGGHYDFTWSTLTNGPHTIGWYVTDDCNRADGIGSRYFSVSNGAALVAESVEPSVAAARSHAGLRVSEPESNEPITVARGYGELPLIVHPGLGGSRTVEIRQGERVEIRLPRGYESAHQIATAGQVRGLPIGSTWDAAGNTFLWQPSEAFLGRYRLVFSNGRERISVRVFVVP